MDADLHRLSDRHLGDSDDSRERIALVAPALFPSFLLERYICAVHGYVFRRPIVGKAQFVTATERHFRIMALRRGDLHIEVVAILPCSQFRPGADAVLVSFAIAAI